MQQKDYGAPVGLDFGGGLRESLLHPVVAVAMILAVILMLLLPRKYAVVPFLLVVFLTPLEQQLYIGGFHIFVMRILILVGCFRIAGTKLLSQTSLFTGGFISMDALFLVWALTRATAVVLTDHGDPGSIINQCGFLWDALGGYLLLRFLIRDVEDVTRVIKTFALVAMILAVTMLNERLRGQNIFGFLGGVPVYPDMRDSSVRAQGPFSHAILAGVFAATLLPLLLWLWQSKRARFAAIAGAVGATIMVLTSNSSTPLLAYLAVLLGLCFWPFRKQMRVVRWGLVIGLVTLHLIMKAPVWFLIDHVDLIAGNSGYHRAMLIDTCVKHFGDWWLIGSNQMGHWGFDMWDLSNQFVAEAETGGLLAFVCFVLMISQSFGKLGTARKIVGADRHQTWSLWLLGVALFSHVVAFFGISYFDQTKLAWFALFAMIIAVTTPILAEAVPSEEPKVAFVKSRVAYPSLAVSSPTHSRLSEVKRFAVAVKDRT